MRRLGYATAAAAATAAVLAAPSSSAEPAALAFDPPVLVSSTQASRETSLSINPVDPREQVVCDPSGVPATSNGQSYFHITRDGGARWVPLDVEGGQTDTRNYAFEGGDCDVIHDAGGTLYTADTWLGNLSVGASRDGGRTWTGSALSVTSPVVDRPWLTGGPAGTVYLAYHDLQCCTPSLMWFTKSTDHGRTFSPAVPITTANADGAYVWEGNLVASPDGRDLHVVYTRRVDPGVVDAGGTPLPASETVWVAASRDGGASWASTKIATMPSSASYLYPSIARDRGGQLHVVFSSARATDLPVWYLTSKDGGTTWTQPQPLVTGTVGWAPWVDGGAPGEAVVAWLGSPDPRATRSTVSPWYFYAGRITGGGTPEQTVTVGPTTPGPVFTGRQTMPEFEMVRLGPDGRMHLGMSVFLTQGTRTAWAVYHQSESLPTP